MIKWFKNEFKNPEANGVITQIRSTVYILVCIYNNNNKTTKQENSLSLFEISKNRAVMSI